MSRLGLLPVIIGMDPPTKEIIVGKAKTLGGISVLVRHAAFPEGTKRGDRVAPVEAGPTACWLHFTDTGAMRAFASALIEAADMEDGK